MIFREHAMCGSRQGKSAAAELDFELPYYSKYLLLAAYMCSRNKATLDRRIFDPTSRTGKRHGQMSHDKQVINTSAMLL